MKRLACITLTIALTFGALVLQTPTAAAAEPSSPIKWIVEPSQGLSLNGAFPFYEGVFVAKIDDEMVVINENGEIIVSSDVYRIDRFQEGLARVQDDNKYGFIDMTGKMVIPIQYSDARRFTEGLCAVEKDGKWGFIDKTGAEIVPCIYTDVYDFSEGFAAVFRDGNRGFINRAGKIVISSIYSIRESFSEGLAVIGITRPDGSWYYAYIDSTGKSVFPQEFRYASSFSGGIAMVNTDAGSNFINKAGEFTSQEYFYSAMPMSEGLARVYNGELSGFVDKTGKTVIPYNYGAAGTFVDGLAGLRLGNWWGVVDKTGKEIFPFESYSILDPSEGFVVVRDGDGPYGLVDRSGAFVLPYEYNEISPVQGGLAWAVKDGKYGIFKIEYTPALDNFTPSLSYEAGVTFTDVPESAWYFKNVSDAYTFEIISGVGDNKYNPDGNLTGAEVLTIAAKIHAIYKYGSTAHIDKYLYLAETASNWSGKFVAYCKAEGIIGDELDSKLSQPVTRAEMIHAWSKILLPTDMPRQNAVRSLPDVTNDTPYYQEIIAFYEAGIVSGVDAEGTFMPEKEISRAECATIFMNLTQRASRTSGKVFG